MTDTPGQRMDPVRYQQLATRARAINVLRAKLRVLEDADPGYASLEDLLADLKHSFPLAQAQARAVRIDEIRASIDALIASPKSPRRE